MCSIFGLLDMENYQEDLTDIVLRASGGQVESSSGGSPAPCSWPNLSNLHVNFPSSSASDGKNFFGDPFLNMSDPFLHELNMVAASGYFANSGADNISSCSSNSFCHSNNNNINNSSNNNNNSNTNTNSFMVSKIFEDDHMKSQCNIFPSIRISQTIQEASPCNSPVMAQATRVSSPRGINASPIMAPAARISSPRGINRSPVAPINVNVNTNIPKTCLVDNNTAQQLQISSPRNLGLKRRKNQAKKVVCIPAPAAANSRSTGEVVPSDLWAWRKYGQKPIKGSPYPRGYYRCSSSKGCSARKQVERSRTDPNMLVITYTSEHNHPWPTQRNALAGSTRSSNHPSKTNITTTSSSSRGCQPSKEEAKDEFNLASPPASSSSATTRNLSVLPVKEEIEDQMNDEQTQIEMDHDGFDNNEIQSYRPELIPDFHQPEDFFADLDELEGHPLSLLFTQGFSPGGDQHHEDKQALDPFSNFFDCSEDSNNNKNTSNKNMTASCGESAGSL